MIKKIPIVSAAPGNVLAESIYDAESHLLLREGVELTEPMITLLRKRGCDFVHIELDSDSANTCDTCGERSDVQPTDRLSGPVRAWICGDCGEVYFSAVPNLISDERAVDIKLSTLREISLPAAVEHAFNESWERNQYGADKRKHKRYVISLPATVVPLNQFFKIAGEAVKLKTHDVSQGGVCLIHVAPLDCPYIYVDFNLPAENRVRMLAKIVRQRERAGAHEIGCMYISRIVGEFAESAKKCHGPEPVAKPSHSQQTALELDKNKS